MSPPDTTAYSWSWQGAPKRAPTCRRSGCSGTAGADGLCEAHAEAQQALRRLQEVTAQKRAHVDSVTQLMDALAEVVSLRSEPWRELAACRGHLSTMFPRRGGGHPLDFGPAAKLCRECPVRAECGALGTHEVFGTWGASRRKHQGRVTSGWVSILEDEIRPG